MKSKTMLELVKEGARRATDYTVEMSKVAGTRLVEFEQLTPLLAKRFNINRNIHKQYEELGEITYELLKLKGSQNLGDNADVKELSSEIRALENNVLHVEKQIEELKMKYQGKIDGLKNNKGTSKN